MVEIKKGSEFSFVLSAKNTFQTIYRNFSNKFIVYEKSHKYFVYLNEVSLLNYVLEYSRTAKQIEKEFVKTF